MYKNLMTVCCAAALALGLAACGGGGGSDGPTASTQTQTPTPMPTPMPVSVALPAGHGFGVGETALTAGATSVRDLLLTCEPAEGSDGCTLTVKENAVLNTVEAESTGGTVMVLRRLELPKIHMLTAGATVTVRAGATMENHGVEFTCPAGGEDCVISVVEIDGQLQAGYTGGSAGGVVMAMQVEPDGWQSYQDYAGVLLDGAKLADLRANLYADGSLEDDPATSDILANPATPGMEAAVPDTAVATSGDESMQDPAGVTSSYTTHEQPGTQGEADPLTGVSDIFVHVTPEIQRADDAHAMKVVQRIAAGTDIVAADPNADPPVVAVVDGDTVDYEISNPVMVDETGMAISNRTADFVAEAEWDLNPAAEWVTDALAGATANMDDDATDIWTHYFQLEDQELPGGRTLHVDLRSDFDPNTMSRNQYIDIARGPSDDGTPERVQVDASMVRFDGIEVQVGGEIDIPTAGLPGSYMGVKGLFTCVNGTTDNEGDICRVNRHTPDKITPSEDSDLLRFTPYVYTPDTDWLAAGVWLTIPDRDEGDFAIGAFVYGNNPYRVGTGDADDAAAALADINAITGTATYHGQAFGRYAEDDDGAMSVGRFTADAELTADFGADNVAGSIQGDLTGFVANGEDRDWDVNFESAAITAGMMDDPADTDPSDGTDQVTVVNSTLRFNAGASGHGTGGHALTGYWNGQFYGDTSMTVDNTVTDNIQPTSAAGTFGLTTERDREDNYSLTMTGAFATHRQTPADEE